MHFQLASNIHMHKKLINLQILGTVCNNMRPQSHHLLLFEVSSRCFELEHFRLYYRDSTTYKELNMTLGSTQTYPDPQDDVELRSLMTSWKAVQQLCKAAELNGELLLLQHHCSHDVQKMAQKHKQAVMAGLCEEVGCTMK